MKTKKKIEVKIILYGVQIKQTKNQTISKYKRRVQYLDIDSTKKKKNIKELKYSGGGNLLWVNFKQLCCMVRHVGGWMNMMVKWLYQRNEKIKKNLQVFEPEVLKKWNISIQINSLFAEYTTYI